MDKNPKNRVTIRSSAAEYLTYIASAGIEDTSPELCYEDENIRITQKLMAVLYDIDLPTINYPIKKSLPTLNLTKRQLFENFE